MDINKEIQNLLNHRAWLLEQKERLNVLDMLKMKETEQTITGLDVTIKRLRRRKKQCEAAQIGMNL